MPLLRRDRTENDRGPGVLRRKPQGRIENVYSWKIAINTDLLVLCSAEKSNLFLRQLRRLKNTLKRAGRALAPSSEEAHTALFPPSVAKTPLCSLLLPHQSKAACFALKRRSSGMSELSCRYTEARDRELATTQARVISIANLVCNRKNERRGFTCPRQNSPQ